MCVCVCVCVCVCFLILCVNHGLLLMCSVVILYYSLSFLWCIVLSVVCQIGLKTTNTAES